jgi:hypothetical protein
MDLDLAPWLQLLSFVHVLGVLAFVLFHGVSAVAALQLRRERDRARITWLVDLSASMLVWGWMALVVVLLAGILAGIAGGWWTSGRLWIWVSLGIFLAVTVLMTPVASSYMEAVRHAVGLPSIQDRRKKREPPPPASDAELATVLDSRRPVVAAVIGIAGIVVLIWLMAYKPF